MNIESKPFKAIRADVKNKRFGMVVTGAGGILTKWVEGLEALLLEAKIIPSAPAFEEAYTLSNNNIGIEGRTDLVLIFTKDLEVNVGKLAIWRLQFGGISWMDDFIDNYGKDYKRTA